MLPALWSPIASRLAPQVFFDLFLPPIIFQAGFSVKKKVRSCGIAEALPSNSDLPGAAEARCCSYPSCPKPPL